MSIPGRAWHHADLSNSGVDESIVLSMLEASAEDSPQGHPLTEEAAVLKFTSGSTGEPKGIALGPDQVRAEADNIVSTLGLSPEDRILADVPLVHSYGFDLGVLALLFSGARLVLQDFFVPNRIAGDLEREGISVYLGVPPQYRRWIEGAPPADRPVASVRYLLSCTAPLDSETILAFHDRFAMVLCQHYGSSETGAAANHIPSEVLARPGSVGTPVKNVRIRVLDEAGHEVAPGEVGEIEVHSAAVARGYILGAPTERTPFREGAFLIGDLAVRDADGFIHLRGRVDQLINIGGFKVSPEEVRRVLEGHPAVREAGVIGVPDPTGETAVSAMVALKSQTTEKELTAWCYGRLADYKVPRRIHLRDELPRGPGGKVRIRPEDAPL
jgi:long-chain acyl-CoA synthetase